MTKEEANKARTAYAKKVLDEAKQFADKELEDIEGLVDYETYFEIRQIIIKAFCYGADCSKNLLTEFMEERTKWLEAELRKN